MKEQSRTRFNNRLFNKKRRLPLDGFIELTYRCNLRCVHCFCKGSEEKGSELDTNAWKEIIDELHKEGCLGLTFSGGDPLIREDFLEIYAYAKAKGFLIGIFSSGQAFTDEIIDYLVKSPPSSIEITLNGITQDTYESITQVSGSFERVMRNIRKLAENKLPLILKANCLKQNKNELVRIKRFCESLLGKPKGRRYLFKYDPFILPRLNGDKLPNNFRVSSQEILEICKGDIDFYREYQESLREDIPDQKRANDFLFRCDVWLDAFNIDPFGRLKPCQFYDKFSVDLKTTPFKDGFYKEFPKIFLAKFKTASKCKDCRLRPLCYYCPARAFLETGDEESPVPYYCELAQKTAEQMKSVGNDSVLLKSA